MKIISLIFILLFCNACIHIHTGDTQILTEDAQNQISANTSPANWVIDPDHDFILQTKYVQKTITPLGKQPKYTGTPIQYCIKNMPPSAYGFFYQKHSNGCEIVGYYLDVDKNAKKMKRVKHHKVGYIVFREK